MPAASSTATKDALDGIRRWQEGGSLWVVLASLGVLVVLALLSQRATTERTPSAIRTRAKDLLRTTTRSAAAVRYVRHPAHAVSQCDAILARLDTVRTLLGGDRRTLDALAGCDVDRLRADVADQRERAWNNMMTPTPS